MTILYYCLYHKVSYRYIAVCIKGTHISYNIRVGLVCSQKRRLPPILLCKTYMMYFDPNNIKIKKFWQSDQKLYYLVYFLWPRPFFAKKSLKICKIHVSKVLSSLHQTINLTDATILSIRFA